MGGLAALKRHEKLIGALGANERKSLLTVEQLKNLLELDDIIVGEAVSTPAANKATQDIWGKFASLIVRPHTASGGNDEGEPSFGYTFRRRGMPVVDRYEEVGGKVEYARYTDIRKTTAQSPTLGGRGAAVRYGVAATAGVCSTAEARKLKTSMCAALRAARLPAVCTVRRQARTSMAAMSIRRMKKAWLRSIPALRADTLPTTTPAAWRQSAYRAGR